ncbi:MAG TPA: lipid-binding SYLF domain-containing protein [Methylomirabilota bacterium]|jgi:lipid-binding SYLF domain-containing protein
MRDGMGWSGHAGIGLMCLLGLAGCAKPSAETASATATLEAERDRVEARQLVDRARLTLESFAADPRLSAQFREVTQSARGVFVAPEVLRGALVVGASGGNGLFMTRGAKPGEWRGPAFYKLADLSWGLQAGGDSSEVVLLAMTERGVTALLSNNVKLGAGVGVAAGPVGGGAAGSTAALSADILSYSRAKGLYAGISLDGAVVATRDEWNRAYYGKEVTPTDVLVTGGARDAGAAKLVEALNRIAVAK